MYKNMISYGHGEVNRDSISSSLSGADMDEYTYTAPDGCEITLVYDSTADDEKVVKDIKSLMVSMAAKQVRNTKGA